MRVFHGPLNIAGIAGTLSQAEREAGIDSFSYCLPTASYQYRSDFTVEADSDRKMISELMTFAFREIREIDIFHFYFGRSLTLSHLSEVPLLKTIGKKIFFYFHGCDIRDSKYVINHYPINACQNHWPMACSANRKKAIAVAKKYADGVFVSTPDLLEFIPGSSWLPQPISLEHFKVFRDKALSLSAKVRKGKQEILVAHAPSDRMIKGTQYLEQAVQKLKKKGYPIKLLLVENLPYEKALTYFLKADIVVDQLLVGAYGMFSVEMMAMGKPVICYLREDLVKNHYSTDLPIISATPFNIADVLEETIERRKEWQIFGDKGIQYVHTVHDSQNIAAKTIQYYQAAY